MKENKLYNPGIKEKYLSKFENEDNQTQNTIRYVLSKSYVMEESRQRDLYDFNLEEIGNVIKNFANPRNIGVAKSIVRFISGYISWACDAGLRENGINPLSGLTKDEEWIQGLVDTSKKLHYSEGEFLDLLDLMSNSQDKALLMLMFEGIIGKSLSQLAMIKIEDIDVENNKVFVEERNGYIDVSKKCIEYIKEALIETSYNTYIEKENKYNERPLLPSPYLFKNLETPRTVEGNPVGIGVLYSRLTQIKNEFHLDFMTPNIVKQSGQIYMAAEICMEKLNKGEPLEMKYEDFEKIGDKYDLSKISSNGYDYYNTTLMKQYISQKNLKELYNLDVEM